METQKLENDMETGVCTGSAFWKEGMEKNMETTMMGYVGITIRIHCFIPS